MIAGDGISFAGKDPNFKINAATGKIILSAGERLGIKGTYPNFRIERKKHYIGKKMDGGVVFYVTNYGQHGLIAKASDKEGTRQTFFWKYTNKEITPKDFKEPHCTGDEIGSGKDNTFVMLFFDKYNDIVDIGEPYSIPQPIRMGDWFIPSIKELQEAYNHKNALKDILNLGSRKKLLFPKRIQNRSF